jgi:Cytochrome c554 and c-prime
MARKLVLSARLAIVLAMVAVASLSLGTLGTARDDPPEGQTYVGSKKCSSCHFEQYMAWKKDSHSKVFELLPPKYQKDAKCLKCHTTGSGEPTGFKDIKSTPNLAGVTCESCHGAGSKHCEIAEKYGKKKLSAEEEKLVRESTWLQLPNNVCSECHKTKAHGKSETPKELLSKKKK